MPPEAGQESIGVVLAANGEVFLRSESGVRQVESGAEVFRGEELVTGSGSTAEVRFVDDTLLSQGADSVISLDDYVFDDSASDAELLFKMSQGTFRLVTGKIAEQNPDRFQVGTPLATIGIRGTTIVSEIMPGGGQKIGVEEIHAGKALLVQSISGEIRMIANARELVDIAMSGQLGTVRPMSVQEFNSFREIAPTAIRQEQEIQQQRQEEQQQDDPQDDPDQNPDEQGQDAQGGDGDVEGGETGGPAIPGQGVLDPGIGVVVAGGIGQVGPFAGGLGPDLPPGALAEIEGLAGEILGAINSGDINTAQNLLNNLQGEIDDVIDELIGSGETYTSSEGSDAQTYTSGDGTTFILGGSADNSYTGTSGADYYDGQGGNDYISGQMGNDVLHGGPGNDTVIGNEGNDVLRGGAGEDTISGNCDNDIIHGDGDDDTIYGGKGADSMYGGDGWDTVSFSDITPTLEPYINMNTGIASIDHVEDFFTNFEAVVGTDVDGVGDYIEGDGNDNDLFGLRGDDTLKGGAGDDRIEGGAGNDELYGGAGSDTISGGGGADTIDISGDSVTDKLIYYLPTDGADNVTGFTSGEDKFVFDSSNFTVGGTPYVQDNGYDGTTGSASGGQFIYDADTDGGKLWYDDDGDGGNAGVVIATGIGSTFNGATDIDFN
ncbi:FecR domain-containing protein [Desulfovibrio sp. JC010]|uniref:FecR domain-containing protein n=1 Tax=Desulfovibrio sp. JC010 TaxID=2593641 RepID=UPI0013D5F8C5|nr:FecR domain-containing protein [Desulfovibrio sp. JC010]NDV25341.1 hypothetical protein [Desulfovibrio sp. JC010]